MSVSSALSTPFCTDPDETILSTGESVREAWKRITEQNPRLKQMIRFTEPLTTPPRTGTPSLLRPGTIVGETTGSSGLREDFINGIKRKRVNEHDQRRQDMSMMGYNNQMMGYGQMGYQQPMGYQMPMQTQMGGFPFQQPMPQMGYQQVPQMGYQMVPQQQQLYNQQAAERMSYTWQMVRNYLQEAINYAVSTSQVTPQEAQRIVERLNMPPNGGTTLMEIMQGKTNRRYGVMNISPSEARNYAGVLVAEAIAATRQEMINDVNFQQRTAYQSATGMFRPGSMPQMNNAQMGYGQMGYQQFPMSQMQDPHTAALQEMYARPNNQITAPNMQNLQSQNVRMQSVSNQNQQSANDALSKLPIESQIASLRYIRHQGNSTPEDDRLLAVLENAYTQKYGFAPTSENMARTIKQNHMASNNIVSEHNPNYHVSRDPHHPNNVTVTRRSDVPPTTSNASNTNTYGIIPSTPTDPTIYNLEDLTGDDPIDTSKPKSVDTSKYPDVSYYSAKHSRVSKRLTKREVEHDAVVTTDDTTVHSFAVYADQNNLPKVASMTVDVETPYHSDAVIMQARRAVNDAAIVDVFDGDDPANRVTSGQIANILNYNKKVYIPYNPDYVERCFNRCREKLDLESTNEGITTEEYVKILKTIDNSADEIKEYFETFILDTFHAYAMVNFRMRDKKNRLIGICRFNDLQELITFITDPEDAANFKEDMDKFNKRLAICLDASVGSIFNRKKSALCPPSTLEDKMLIAMVESADIRINGIIGPVYIATGRHNSIDGEAELSLAVNKVCPMLVRQHILMHNLSFPDVPKYNHTTAVWDEAGVTDVLRDVYNNYGSMILVRYGERHPLQRQMIFGVSYDDELLVRRRDDE